MSGRVDILKIDLHLINHMSLTISEKNMGKFTKFDTEKSKSTKGLPFNSHNSWLLGLKGLLSILKVIDIYF